MLANIFYYFIECGADVTFVADEVDLCRYHWCINGAPTEMACAPGSRVNTK